MFWIEVVLFLCILVYIFFGCTTPKLLYGVFSEFANIVINIYRIFTILVMNFI